MLWKVEISDEARRELREQFRAGVVSKEDVAVIKAWVVEIEQAGPARIRSSRLWDDHDLEGEWLGFRSSCFSRRGRIIYRVFENRVFIEVVRITGTHDYRR